MKREPYEAPAIEASCDLGGAELARLDAAGCVVVTVEPRPFPSVAAFLNALAALAAREREPRKLAGGALTVRFVVKHPSPRRLQRLSITDRTRRKT